MIWTSIKRIIKAGFVNFWRNAVVSVVTILIMVTTLFVIGSLIFGKALLTATLAELENKVDVTVYFKTDASEDDIFTLHDSILKLDEVKEIEYVSSDEALAEFKKRHADNSLIISSLEELGENPLGANFNIKAKDPSQYESIAKFLESADSGGVLIDKVNYYQNKMVIERLSLILDSSRKLGFGISMLLIFISIFVVFNTIRLTIYIARKEISVMRLVGATNSYVRGPFIVEGAMYGVFAAVLAMILFYPFLLWLGPLTQSFFSGINIFDYYVSNLLEIFLILALVGVFIGTFSSWIAVRKYLKV